jgi:hypothetical protein
MQFGEPAGLDVILLGIAVNNIRGGTGRASRACAAGWLRLRAARAEALHSGNKIFVFRF